MAVGYRKRHVDVLLDQEFDGLPAVMLTGPRGCGKTTTGLHHARSVLRLDEPSEAQVFAGAPDAVLASQREPVLIDEWQEVPASLGAVKRAVDAGTGGGRFLLTGSVRARSTGAMWPGTGRVVPLRMYGLTQAEVCGEPDPARFLRKVFGAGEPEMRKIDGAPNLVDYVTESLRGGFPESREMTERQRGLWAPGYVDQLVHRDVAALAEVRAPARLGALLESAAASTAGLPQLKTLTQAAQVDGRTVNGYLDLLDDLRIIDRVPAWHSNHLQRLVKSSKLYLTDTGLVAALLAADREAVLRNSDLLGRLIDTFVYLQIAPLAALSTPRVSLHHLRDTNGTHEVDLVLEGPGGNVVGLEIKASANVSPRDARHLAWLRDRLGERFHRGVVLHAGEHVHQLGDRIWACPIAWIWS